MSDNSFPALSYSQPGGNYYACVIPAVDIVHRLDIRRRSSQPKDGIQRDDNAKRVADIARYVTEPEAILPTPIIVSANTEVVRYEAGKIVFSDSSKPIGHVLDGQHRILGLQGAESSIQQSFQLLVVFVFNIDVYAEATIFATINGNQKQVSKSLMYDLFSLHPGRSLEKVLHEVVKSLNSDDSSPFFKRIKVLGTKVEATETLSQAAFIDQLKRQVKKGKSPLYDLYEAGEDWAIRKIVANCFSALVDAQREANSNFEENYFFRTTGFGGVVQALGALAKRGESTQDMSQSYFRQVMDKFFEKMTEPPAGVGNSAMLEIKKNLLEANGIPND